MIFRFITLIGLLLGNLLSITQAVDFDVQQTWQPVSEGVSVIVEPVNGRYQVDDVVALTNSDWQPVTGAINAGYTDAGHWYRILIRNASPFSAERLLELAYPLLDHIEFHEVYGGMVVQSFVTGDALAFRDRPLVHRNFVFPLTIPANDHVMVYLRVQTAGAHQVPLTLWEERAFHANSEKGLGGRAIFYGILLVMAAFNLFLFFSLRERAYLYYVLLVTPMLLLMTAMHGVSFQYLYPDSPRLHEMMILTMVPIALITMCLFTVGFFNLKQSHPLWYRLFQVLMVLAGIAVIGAFLLPYGTSTRLSVFLALPVCIANISAGIMLWSSGEKSARLFSLGWFALITGSMLMVLNKLGVLPVFFLTEHGIPLGAAAQSLVFSFALASRLNQEREARIQAVHNQQQAQEKFLHAASHNEVTGLPNQILFEQVIHNSFPTTSAHNGNATKQYSICVLQLRHYDEVQKTLGHEHTDALQHEIAERLNQALLHNPNVLVLDTQSQPAAVTAHLDSGRFAFAISQSQREQLNPLIKALADTMAAPINFHGLQLEFGFLFGLAVRDSRQDVPLMIRQAIIAFEQANHERDGIAFYRASMSPYSTRRLDLMTDLRFAIEQDALTIQFQPRISLKGAGIVAFEALVRWSHPEHGDITPAEFIPLAERTGLISALSRWMISQSLAFIGTLDNHQCSAAVSINISANNLLEPGFCQQLDELLTQHQASPKRLMLEITDSAANADETLMHGVLNDIKQRGVALALDDFGSGHHSLRWIRGLPLDDILIARDFIKHIHKNRGDATIVRTTVEMCHELGFRTVAQGVETAETVNALKQADCDIAQGYYFSPPLSETDALQWLGKSQWAKKQ